MDVNLRMHSAIDQVLSKIRPKVTAVLRTRGYFFLWTRCTGLKLPPRFNKMQDYRQLFTCDKKKNASIQDFRLYKLSEQSKSDNAGNARRFCNLPHLVITDYILGSLQRLNDSIRPFEN